MNRDEQRARAKALPPDRHRCGDHEALYPSEPGGGTWIGFNNTGLFLALINWYSRPQCPGDPAFSRGEIIPRLLACASREEMDALLRSFPLDQLNPFRLFVISNDRGGVHEYRSDRSGIDRVDHPRDIGHWFSSGHDETSATKVRATVCLRASSEHDAGTTPWLVRLHSSHDPERGADSVCMHRKDAVTVSLTTVEVSGDSATMRYHNGSPCALSGEGFLHTGSVMIVKKDVPQP